MLTQPRLAGTRAATAACGCRAPAGVTDVDPTPSRSFSHPLQRPTPTWWTSQKFSLFMHWGLYAVPAFCPVTEADKTCYAEHFWDTSHLNGKPSAAT